MSISSILYVNFYIYIAIQFLFSLYVLLFIYFLNYFDWCPRRFRYTRVIYMETLTFTLQYIFCFLFMYFYLSIFEIILIMVPQKVQILLYTYIYIYIIYGIFILVKILSLNLFGIELIYHMKLGDLCEKNYLQFFYEFLLTQFNYCLNYMIFFIYYFR